MKRTNRWYEAIMHVLDGSPSPLTPKQIWQIMDALGFVHSSKNPHTTLCARLQELRAMKTVERVDGGRTYRRATPSHTNTTPVDSYEHLSENTLRG